MVRLGNSGCGGWIIGLIALIALPLALYGPLDRAGWILHSRNTPVWILEDWQVGEYRNCQMLGAAPRLFCGSLESAGKGGGLSEFIGSVASDDFTIAFNASMARNAKTDWTPLSKYFHVLPVLYHRRIERPDRDRDLISWLCQRKSDSLTCNALD